MKFIWIYLSFTIILSIIIEFTLKWTWGIFLMFMIIILPIEYLFYIKNNFK